jgi:hypothetical protein
MITTPELHRWAEREGLRFDQAEKDCIILLVLTSLARTLGTEAPWILKGGTCLRHCYYQRYRFSEDIDFTCLGPDLQKSLALLARITASISEETGIALRCKDSLAAGEDAQVEVPIEYSRGGPRTHGLPAVKIHLTFDEPLLTRSEWHTVTPSWPGIKSFAVSAYSKIEMVAEKMRALIQQQGRWPRARHLYDLWYMTCYRGETYAQRQLRDLFERKCQVRGVPADPSLLRSDHLREWIRDSWTSQLVPMLTHAPDYNRVWSEWSARSEGLI